MGKLGMTRFYRLLFSLCGILVASQMVLAQRGGDDGAAGCAACGASMVFIIVVCVGALALNIALLVWVARDAKARGMDSAVLWMVLVLFTSWVGLIIYIFSR